MCGRDIIFYKNLFFFVHVMYPYSKVLRIFMCRLDVIVNTNLNFQLI
jgi:hypothetical protein